MDFALTEEQLSFKALAREFLDREVVPHRAAWDRVESVDIAIVPKLGELGFFGLTIPEEYGGLGGDYITYCIGMEELGRADSSVRGIVSVSMGLVGKVILSHGTEEQKQEWLPPIATGAKLACFGLTEPDTGSDAGNLTTRAVRDGGDYVLNGQKMFITNATWSDLCLVFARTGGPGPKGVSAFLVPTDTPGFEAHEIKGKLGLRGQATAEIFLTGCPSPPGWARRVRGSRSRCTRWTRVGCRSGPAAWGSSRAAWSPSSSTPRTATSSAGPSRPSS
jgi:alkylation response protein AidB-like acyl-CoA dehydrogenase